MAFGFTNNNVIVYDSVSGTLQPCPFTIDNTGTVANAMVSLASINATGTPSSSTFLRGDGTWSPAAGGGGGTVTSVTFTGDGTVLSSTPSTAVTTSGTVTGTLLTQTPNFVLAGPASGSTHLAPTFRALVALDIPTLNQNTTGTAANLSGTPTLPSGTTLVAPVLGTPASGTLTNCTFPTLNQNTTGTAANLSGTPTLPSGTTLVAPVLGTPASGTLTNCTGLPAASIVAGTMASGMTLIAPALGTPTALVLTNATGSCTLTGLTAATVTSTGGLNAGTTKFAVNSSGLCTEYNSVALTGNGIPSSVGIATATTASAAVVATTLLGAPVAATLYRVSCYLKITVATSTPVAGPVTLTYADKDGVAQSIVMALTNAAGAIATSTGNTTTTPVQGDAYVYCNSGTALKYAIAFSGSGTYEYIFKCEAL